MADSGFVDDEWMELWASDHHIAHSNSFYSMPPIDEDYEWSMSSIPQLMARMSRRASVQTLPPIGEEMFIPVRVRSSWLAVYMCTNFPVGEQTII
jgi:hypothetical protein